MKSTKQKDLLILHISLISILLLFAIASVAKVSDLWGFNLLKFFDGTTLALALVLIVIVALPPVSSKVLQLLKNLSCQDDGKKRKLLFYAIGVSTLIALAGLYYPSTAHLLGDSNLRLNQVHQGRLFLPTEALDFFLHSMSYKVIFQPLGFKVYHVYWVISAICGFIFGVGVFRLARHLFSDQIWITFLLMLSSGILVLFFGYVESYSLIAALLPHIYLVGIKATEGRARKSTYVIMCALGALAHSVALIIFLPGLLLLFITSGDYGKNRAKTMTIIMTGLISLLVAAGYIGRHFGFIDPEAYLMPLFSKPEYQQGLLTVNHIVNILNWTLLVSLPALFLAPYVLASIDSSRFFSERKNLYALWTTIPSIFFVIFFTPQLGGPCDWDLFAVPAFLLIPGIITVYSTHIRQPLPTHSVPVAAISIVLTLSFVAVNHSVAKSIDRYSEIIEISKFKNLTKQYLLLVNTADAAPEVRHRKLEFLHKAWDQPPYTRHDSLKVLTGLALAYLEKGNKEPSYRYITQALDLNERNIDAYQVLFRYQRKYGTAEDLHNTARLIEQRFADNAEALIAAAVAYRESGDSESSGRCLKLAYELKSNDYHIVMFYGRHLLEAEKYTQAVDILARAVRVDEKSFQVHYLTAVAYANLGKIEKAREFLAKAKSLQRSNQEAEQVLSLDKRLR